MKLSEILAKFNDATAFIKAVDEQLLKLIYGNLDFIYNPDGRGFCSYNTGAPESNSDCTGCIFGQALQALGWSHIGELNSPETVAGLLNPEMTAAYGEGCVVPECWIKIQYSQDSGKSWGYLRDTYY